MLNSINSLNNALSTKRTQTYLSLVFIEFSSRPHGLNLLFHILVRYCKITSSADLKMLLAKKGLTRFSSVQVFRLQSHALSTNSEWENAKPLDAIPGPKNAFELIRLMGPGGKYFKLPLSALHLRMRRDFGTITKIPGFMGQRPLVFTYLPEDVEKVLRVEGKYPYRRPFDSIAYFKKHHRPDMYPAGGGLVVTCVFLILVFSVNCVNNLTIL